MSLLLLATPDVRELRGATTSVDNSAFHCRLLAFQVSPVNSDKPHHSVVTVVCEAYGTCELYPRLARQMATSGPLDGVLYSLSDGPSRFLSCLSRVRVFIDLASWPALDNILQNSHNCILFHYTVVLTIVASI